MGKISLSKQLCQDLLKQLLLCEYDVSSISSFFLNGKLYISHTRSMFVQCLKVSECCKLYIILGFTPLQSEIIVSSLINTMNGNMAVMYKDMVTKVQQVSYIYI